MPCDPSGGSTGFVDAGKGRVGVELGPLTAQALQELEVVRGVWPESNDGAVLWRIERSGEVPADWVGPVIIGQVPAGFTETVGLEQRLPDRWSVSISNGCYGDMTGVPETELRPDRITRESGETVAIEEFRTEDLGFSLCEPPLPATARVLSLVGVVLGAVGLAVAIMSSMRRRRTDGSAARVVRRE